MVPLAGEGGDSLGGSSGKQEANADMGDVNDPSAVRDTAMAPSTVCFTHGSKVGTGTKLAC